MPSKHISPFSSLLFSSLLLQWQSKLAIFAIGCRWNGEGALLLFVFLLFCVWCGESFFALCSHVGPFTHTTHPLSVRFLTHKNLGQFSCEESCSMFITNASSHSDQRLVKVFLLSSFHASSRSRELGGLGGTVALHLICRVMSLSVSHSHSPRSCSVFVLLDIYLSIYISSHTTQHGQRSTTKAKDRLYLGKTVNMDCNRLILSSSVRSLSTFSYRHDSSFVCISSSSSSSLPSCVKA